MEAKQWFDLITHLFIFFPVVAIYKFTKDDNIKLKNALLIITGLMIVFSIIHHSLPEIKWLEAADELFVGLSIIFVFLIYIDDVYNFDEETTSKYYSTITTFGLIVTLAIYVVFVITDTINDQDYIIWVVASIALISVILFFVKKRWKGHYGFYLYTSVVFAALASIMFLNNSMDPDFYKHSLWHTFAFISFGYLVLFAVIKRTGQEANEKCTIMLPEDDVRRDSVIGLQYAVSLSVRLLIIGYFTYAASLDDTPEGWRTAAFVYGGVVILIEVLKWALKYDIEWKDIRILTHGAVWILVGIVIGFHWFWVLGFLILDFSISIWFNWKNILKYKDALVKGSPNSNNPVKVTELPPLRYKYNMLRF